MLVRVVGCFVRPTLAQTSLNKHYYSATIIMYEAEKIITWFGILFGLVTKKSVYNHSL